MFNPIIPTHEYTLPSNGLLESGYKKVKIRAITGKEEMTLMSSSMDKAIDTIIKSCVVDSKSGASIDPSLLCPADKLFILIMLRSVTYGDSLRVNYQCDSCGSDTSSEIPLSDLPITYLTKDMLDDLEFELPDSKVGITLKILPDSAIAKLERDAERLAKRINANPKEALYMLKLTKRISSLSYEDEQGGPQVFEGTDANQSNIQFILEKVTGKDIATIDRFIDKSTQFGIDMTYKSKCPRCGAEVELAVSLRNTEFFRPTVD